MESALTIGRAARAAGVGVETIRFYERQQLIEQPVRGGPGPRRYPPDVVERVRFIREAQRVGFTLRDVRDLFALRADPAADCSEIRERAATKLEQVRGKIEQLQRIGDALQALIGSCPAHGPLEACTILTALSLPGGCDGSCGSGREA